ncbi:MAG: nucleotide exchange factor GrpE [bacterium]
MKFGEKPSEPPIDSHLENKLSELEILRQSFEEKKKLADSYYDQLLRLKAEFDNYRKRMEKEREELVEFGKQELMVKLLDILDSLDLALHSTKDEKNEAKSIKEGVELIHKQFKEILEREGLKKLKVQGEKFDPNLHHAVEYQESDEHKDNEILKEVRPGYLLHDRVIRPAMVVVARAKKQEK